MHAFIPAPDDVVAVKLRGRSDKEDVAAIYGACRSALARAPTVSAYVDLTAWEGFAMDGLVEDVADAIEAIGWWTRVRRKAVVTDQRWIHAWIRTLGGVIRQPEVRAFASADAAAAFAWASAGAPAAAPAANDEIVRPG